MTLSTAKHRIAPEVNMDVGRLATYVTKPEVHRSVLRHYSGPYALGVTRLDNNDEMGALRLRVEDAKADDFPSEIDVHGEKVPVLVDVDWKAPTPQLSGAGASIKA
jgi:hypothetical protein